MITEAQRDDWLDIIEQRDKTHRGQIFHGVRTTKIVCTPGCPARMPKRENILLFETLDTAFQNGFRACKRCRPEK
ncbi:Ada metal-binding domain-containing protein [Limoniibacter endophyticus]|uniref:Ada DNA repair metal-binding domain-containing protein n=1 Tax=Limoniibacter endophyticus TaxID=1565040 RepID=A0A8J3DGB7_9HYPH|nr:hypothetical protein GCM10010136_04710 [Limoniibacter endophyticus]